MNIFDMRTVVLNSVIGCVLCTLVIFQLWLQNRNRSRAFGFWLAAYLTGSTGMLLLVLRGQIPDIISIALVNPLSLGGILLGYIGLEFFAGRPNSLRFDLFAWLVFSLVNLYFSLVLPNLSWRIIILSLGLLLICSRGFWWFVRNSDPNMQKDARVLVVVFAGSSLVSLARIVAELLHPLNSDFFRANTFDAVFVMVYGMMLIAMTFALFLMVNRRLILDLERDINVRKKAEAALKTSEEKFFLVFQNAPDAISLTTLADGKYLDANPAFSRIVGYSLEEVIGKTSVELNLWLDIAERQSFVDVLFKNERAFKPDMHFRKKSGEMISASVFSELIQLQGVSCMLSVIHDTTEEKRVAMEVQRLAKLPFENPNPVLRIGRDAVIQYANPASAPLLAAWASASGQLAPAAYVSQICDALESGQSYEFEIDCAGRLFLFTISPVPAEGYVNLYGQDVTERKLAEEALSQSEKKYRTLHESMIDGYVSVSMLGSILEYNDIYRDMLGYSDEELLHQTYQDITPEYWRDFEAGIVQDQILKRGYSDIYEKEYRRKDGSIFPVELHTVLIYSDEGQPAGMWAIVRDITARKHAEAEIHRHLSELEVLYENSRVLYRLWEPADIGQKILEILSSKLSWHHAAIRMRNPETGRVEVLALSDPNLGAGQVQAQIDFLNQRISTSGHGLSGWVIEHGQVVRSANVKTDSRYYETYPEIRSGLYVPMRSAERTVGSISVESEHAAAFSAQDERLLVTIAGQAATSIENAQLFGRAQQEIAERKRIEQELLLVQAGLEQRVQERTADLKVANVALEKAARLKDEFLAGMSHELRTPLTGILGLSESLQLNTYGELTDKQSRALKTIQKSGLHLLELINQILDLSKIEAGRFELEITPISIGDICQASLQLARGMAAQKEQYLDYSIEPEQIHIRADGLRLKQMLLNLLGNAVKFTPRGGRLGLEVRGDAAGQCIRICVWDTGIGIKSEDFPRLFQPFVQLDSSLARQYSGTGLGLSLVQRMAVLHGGRVEFESTFGQGSRFTVILPWDGSQKQ